MPPKTRAKKPTNLKENSGVPLKTKNVESKVKKPIRKPLADKTNSASDNTSAEAPLKLAQKVATSKKKSKPTNEVRPRRDRRLPTRFVENQVLINLSNSKENCDIETPKRREKKLSKTKDLSGESTFKSPSKRERSSLVVNRPKRVSRLPSRFEDHSISPNKFAPVQPCHASTPIVQTRTKSQTVKRKLPENLSPFKGDISLELINNVRTKQANKKSVLKNLNSISDSNNNAKKTRSVAKKLNKVVDKPKTSPKGKKRNLNISNNTSLFKFLGEKPNIKKSSRKQDVYEFTFDPDEEPTPKKKKNNPKKKKATIKNPKKVVYKNNYDKNVAKALADLKNKVMRKPETQSVNNVINADNPGTDKQINVVINDMSNDNSKPSSRGMSMKPVNVDNYASIRIEDIAADFDASVHTIDYSPINSPSRPKSPDVNPVTENSVQRPMPRSNDPLNLQENVSFFDEQPVASSSMNVSVRHPLASPWRVEFNNLPIKWQANTYMKPNMTPALESSFINSDESRKKHVYTNLVPQTNDSLDIQENDTPKLKQTSIISFIREVAERSANKKKKMNSKTPNQSKVLSDINLDKNNQEKVSNNSNASAQNVSETNLSGNQSNENISDNIENVSNSKETVSKESRKRRNCNIVSTIPAKSPKRATLFGFDDSENFDQENVSPSKQAIGRRRLMRATRSRVVLQELNEPAGPMRAVVPLAAKTKFNTNSEVVDQLYNELKAAEAPIVCETMHEKNNKSNIQETTWQEDSMSVHLFEDVEMVVKPPRKSYGKAKKVAFRQASSNSDTQDGAGAALGDSSDEEDLSDLTFHIPSEKPKKPAKKKETKKKKLNKREQEEVEAWAAGFNSMCEDVEEFDLVVE